ncbi:MAG: adenylosuccinate lyase [bacterium]|uniref:Adenylosuccinate lyase n=2 Tax=Bacteria candidate phyla TaxID=1783234 RepID=A0A101I175_UNCT6|nr:MAG: Adenylosuccinate lyase [candidate division TA06 bacterium 32_111]KUK87137.1 MAG: Adenylosuccinate lyase [candidate division TA06 bacterium 34_109]MDI6700024.1 adenylosuccinate lyase [bacterium]HAF08409.1 adenylosuccinate lyase [candidate division WOR-3 bacterium]HCP17129.1 adenylosuccinate lyase [candidate division WOR-3 bacterium]
MIKRYSREKMSYIWSDENRYKKYLEVELAVLYAYMKSNVISEDVYNDIKGKAKFDIKRVEEIEKTVRHDVIAFLTAVGENVGENSKYIHMGMTSSDMLDTANALILRESLNLIDKGVSHLRETLFKKALETKNIPIVGRTHGVHAETTSLGLKFLTIVDDLDRVKDMIKFFRKSIARGKISGAVGNYANIPPQIEEIALKRLSLNVSRISSQIVSRDIYSDYLFLLTRIGSIIEKLALQIRLLQRTETREVEEPFLEGQKGSSAMPHKRNPVLCEQMCGLSRVLRGYLLSSLENIALWDERDISHSSVERIILPDASILVDYMLDRISYIVGNLKIYEKNIEKNFLASNNLIFSQRVLLFLIGKGLTREDAYYLVQRNAMESWEKGGDFKQLLKKDKEILKHCSEKELDKLFDKKYYLRFVEDIFKRFS